MKVSFKQSGGYAGLIQGCALDTEALPLEEQAQVQDLVNQSGITDPGATVKREGATAAYDAMNYEITVESDEGQHQVALNDLEVTDAIAPLLTYLIDRAQPQAPEP